MGTTSRSGNIVAFDLGTNLGIAIKSNKTGKAYSYSRKLKGDTLGQRLLAFRQCLREEIESEPISEFAVEIPHGGSFFASRSLFAMLGIIYMVATELEVPVYEYAPASIKKFATGTGKATKESMLRAANSLRLTGTPIIRSTDEADALLCLHFHLAKKELHAS